MSESSTPTGNRPTHIAYTVRDGKDRDGNPKSFWTRVGAAWAHKDLGGITVQLESIPLDGRISLRAASDKPKADETDDARAA